MRRRDDRKALCEHLKELAGLVQVINIVKNEDLLAFPGAPSLDARTLNKEMTGFQE